MRRRVGMLAFALLASAAVAAAGTALTVGPAAAATSEIWGTAQQVSGAGVPTGFHVAAALSAARVRYGKEHAERLTVRVAPQYAGEPTGTVTVKSGTQTVCSIRLTSGTGSCRLSARKLRTGRHRLVATYPGSRSFGKSASAAKYPTVLK